MAQRTVALLALGWLLATAAPAERIVAVGDVHGEIDGFDSVLRAAGLTDAEGRWIGGSAVLVQTGDVTDRGARVRAVMDRLRMLEQQAPSAGGRVVPLLGNHEASNLVHLFDETSTPAEVYHRIWADFAGKNAARRQKAAYRSWRSWHRRYPGCVQQENLAWAEGREAWLADHPPGFAEYIEAISPQGEYGRWLRGLDVVARIDATLFLHGGISPELVERGYGSVEAINRAVGGAIEQFDRDRQRLLDEEVVVPVSSLWEIHCALFVEMARLEQNGGERELARRAELAEINARLPGTAGWFPTDEQGPLWYRGLANGVEAELGPGLDAVLAAFGARRIAVGHTPQPGKIRSRFDGRVFLIDTAMAYPELGGRAAALELDGERVTAIYADERVVLAGEGAAAAPAAEFGARDGSSAGGGEGRAERPGGGSAGRDEDPLESGNGHGEPPLESSNGHEETPLESSNGRGEALLEGSNGHEEAPLESSNGRGVAAAGGGKGSNPCYDPRLGPPPAPGWIGPDSEPLPFQDVEAVLEFLSEAKVIEDRRVGTGITMPRKLLLERDGVRAHAIFHSIRVEKRRERLHGGHVILFFRDHYANNVAAFELSRLLGLDNVPPAVVRRIGRYTGSVQMWIERSCTEEDRRRQGIAPAGDWQLKARDMWVFDNLANNIDRNQGNMLYDAHWKLWFIDHTRSFSRTKKLPSPERVKRCSRSLLQALRELDEAELTRRLKPYLGGYEIDGILARRQLLLELIDSRIAEHGESAVLFDYGAGPDPGRPEDEIEIPAPPPGR